MKNLQYELAASIATDLATRGYSVLLLGPSGCGKTTVRGMVPEQYQPYVVDWTGALYPPHGPVCYLVMGYRNALDLRFTLPQDDLTAKGVHHKWLVGAWDEEMLT